MNLIKLLFRFNSRVIRKILLDLLLFNVSNIKFSFSHLLGLRGKCTRTSFKKRYQKKKRVKNKDSLMFVDKELQELMKFPTNPGEEAATKVT